MALYGAPLPTAPSELRAAVEKAVQHLLLSVGVGANGAGTVVVRCGAHGACVGTRARGTAWIPAYWAQSSSRVADETGAGNAFLGGFVAGLKLADGNPYDAALYGSVSASFVVEQFGLPTLSAAPGPGAAAYEDMHARVSGPPVAQNFTAARCLRAAARREMWNGDVPQRRLELLRMRVAASA